MVSIVSLARGFALTKQKDKQTDCQYIGLSFQEWDRLTSLAREKIEPYMEAPVDNDELEQAYNISKDIGGKYSKKLILAHYQGVKTMSIRLFHGFNPCRSGVTMNGGEYSSIRHCLGHSDEALLASSVYKDLFNEALEEAKLHECVGCRESLGSQKDHLCLQPTDEFVNQMKERGLTVSYPDFLECVGRRIRLLKSECREPYQWFVYHDRFTKPSMIRSLYPDCGTGKNNNNNNNNNAGSTSMETSEEVVA